jgi:RNA polymerase sigma-70 factor, ECF subfamily
MNAIELRLQRTIGQGASGAGWPRVAIWNGAVKGDGKAMELSSLILAIARNGDRASFAELFSIFAPKVKAYLLRLGASHAQADEWVQETFLTVWRKAAYFDPSRAGAATWIFTIARNLRIDSLRKDRRGELVDDPFERDAPVQADDAIFATEREGKVREAMEELSREQVQVIRLSFFEDKPHSEIAEALGLPLGTVKSRLRLAMSRLRQALEDVR